jgi:hypothetical protein
VPDASSVPIASQRVVWCITQMQYLFLDCLTQVLGLNIGEQGGHRETRSPGTWVNSPIYRRTARRRLGVTLLAAVDGNLNGAAA